MGNRHGSQRPDEMTTHQELIVWVQLAVDSLHPIGSPRQKYAQHPIEGDEPSAFPIFPGMTKVSLSGLTTRSPLVQDNMGTDKPASVTELSSFGYLQTDLGNTSNALFDLIAHGMEKFSPSPRQCPHQLIGTDSSWIRNALLA